MVKMERFSNKKKYYIFQCKNNLLKDIKEKYRKFSSVFGKEFSLKCMEMNFVSV